MKINENKEIFMEVRFGDLKPGDTFVDYDEFDNARYYIVSGIGEGVNLKNGSAIRYNDPDCLVIPVEIIGDVKWPDKVIKRK